jgi:ATP-dependent DNA helicase UvrD/PcrA
MGDPTVTDKIKPTAQQQALLDAVADPNSGHLALVARAGCGKTSTILMAVDTIRATLPGREVLVCAFNKAIADEVKEKLKQRGHTDWRAVQASTLHGLGFGLLRSTFKPEVDDKKVRKIVDGLTTGMNSDETRHIYEQYGQQVVALVRMAKQAGFGFFPDLPVEDAASWHRLADHFDINGLDDTSEAEAVVAAAQRVYRLSLAQTNVVDFDDMILFPLIKNLRVKFTKDDVFLDEAQDLSRARQALARKFLGPRGRMIVVGDDRQAIYGFSGADAAALENLTKSLGARTLPLSVTWRCPRAVVKLAQTLVPDIEAAPSAPEGEVLRIPAATTVPASDPTDPQAGDGHHLQTTQWYEGAKGVQLTKTDAVLCRNTAPLISLAYQLIRAKVPCKVEGRAIGDGLKALAQRWKVRTVDALTKKLDVYAERERQKALAKGNEAKAEEVTDRVGTLVEICKAVTAAGRHDVADVVAFIDDLFADGAENVTVLATYHRSKGREWPRVFLLEHAVRCPSKAARQDWARRQEENLAYVAFTRAQKSLVFVD